MFQFDPIEAWKISIFYANVKISMQPMMMDSLLLHIVIDSKMFHTFRTRNTIYDDE